MKVLSADYREQLIQWLGQRCMDRMFGDGMEKEYVNDPVGPAGGRTVLRFTGPTDEIEELMCDPGAADTLDPQPDACRGCKRRPGEGLDPKCFDKDGCGFWKKMAGIIAPSQVDLRNCRFLRDRVSFDVWSTIPEVPSTDFHPAGYGDLWLEDGNVGGSGRWLKNKDMVKAVEEIAKRMWWRLT